MYTTDDAELRRRLWDGFARLQILLGASAPGGIVTQERTHVGSVVASAPDSPALNAVVALDVDATLAEISVLARHYADHRVRRWGLWVDGSEPRAAHALRDHGLRLLSTAPGMGIDIDDVSRPAPSRAHRSHAVRAAPADLPTVGRVNDLAYGNRDGRLERTLSSLPAGTLRAFRVDRHDEPAAVALALHHGADCGVSFVATAPGHRRRGLASQVMLGTLDDAHANGLETVTLQATEVGARLYASLNFRRIGPMQLWEHRR